jgi:hypothetical protein
MASTKPEGRQRFAPSAAIVNDVSWWLFVIASLIAGGVDWWKANGSAVSFSSDIYLYCSLGDGEESRCQVGTSGSGPEQWFTDPAFYSSAAFVVLVSAATVEAFTVGRFMPGIVTVAMPLVAFVMFLAATPDGIAGYDGRPVVAMVVVFVAVVLREMWARRFRAVYADTGE